MKLNRPIVFLDLETTGTSVERDRIVEIACIKINPDGTEEEKVMLINPGMPIPAEASAIHGITAEKIKEAKAPYFKQIAISLLGWLEGCDIGGFNSDRFDFVMLIEEFHRCKIAFPTWELSLVDVYKNELRVKPNKLADLYERYFEEPLEGAHGALADVRATIRILKEQIKSEPEITPEELDNLCQNEKRRFDYAGKFYEKGGMAFFTFGKYRDQPVTVLHTDGWYLNNFFLGGDFPKDSKDKLTAFLKENPAQ